MIKSSEGRKPQLEIALVNDRGSNIDSVFYYTDDVDYAFENGVEDLIEYNGDISGLSVEVIDIDDNVIKRERF